jgi:hypothetical protein
MSGALSPRDREHAASVVAGQCLIIASNRAEWSSVAAETRNGRPGSSVHSLPQRKLIRTLVLPCGIAVLELVDAGVHLNAR